MSRNTILTGAIVALCLIGMLALPASAAPTGQGTTAARVSTVDQGLKDDLWGSHTQYRLSRFDMNVEQANAVIGILNKYGIDTTICQATLTTITSKRADLAAALQAKDKQKLKTVNEDLKNSWKEFLKDVRDAIRSHYGNSPGSTAASTVDSVGLGLT